MKDFLEHVAAIAAILFLVFLLLFLMPPVLWLFDFLFREMMSGWIQYWKTS